MAELEVSNWFLDKLREKLKDPQTNAISGRTWIVNKDALNQSPEYPKIALENVSDSAMDLYIDRNRDSDTEIAKFYDVVLQLNVQVAKGTSGALNYNSRNYTDAGRPSNGKLKAILTNNIREAIEELVPESLNDNEDIISISDVNVTNRDNMDRELKEGVNIYRGIFENAIRIKFKVQSRRT